MSNNRTRLNKPQGRSGKRTSTRTVSAVMLHHIRRGRGLTMRQLAQLTQSSIATVCRWECGRRVPLRSGSRLLSLVLECPALAEWDATPIERDPERLAEVETWARDFIATKTRKRSA